MNTAFKNDVESYGWKHGGLISLQNNNFGDRVPAFHLFKYWENITEKQRQELRNWQEKYNTDTFIVRTSHFGDWDWLVDVMPTYKDISFNNVDQVFEKIQKDLHNPKLIEYAKNEWTDFQPQDCTISIAPYISEEVTTITEHPNTSKSLFLFDDFMYEGREHFRARDFILEWLPSKTVDDIKKISDDIIWNSDITLQIESKAQRQKKTIDFIYQIRKFLDRNPMEIYDRNLYNNEHVTQRSFWTTNKPWTTEAIQEILTMNPHYTERQLLQEQPENENPHDRMNLVKIYKDDALLWALEHYKSFEKASPEEQYVWFQTSYYKSMTQGLNFTQPKNMQIYFGASGIPALSHMHTRNIKQVFKNPNGSAYIADRTQMIEIIQRVNESSKRKVMAYIIPGVYPNSGYII